ncbi:MAG: methyl-accepting chemotaxis protein [Azonexus sp.]
MGWFDHLPLRYKLLVNFVASGGVLLLALVFLGFQIRAVGGHTQEIAKSWLPSVEAAAQISQLRLRFRVRSLEYMLPGSAEEKGKIRNGLKSLDTALNEALQAYVPLVTSEAERRVHGEAVAAIQAYKAEVDKAIALAESGDEEGAQTLRRTAWVKAADLVRDKTDELLKLNSDGTAQASQVAEGAVATGVQSSIISLVLGAVLALLVSWLVARRMERQLNEAVTATQRIAGGDLSGELPMAGHDEIGRMIEGLKAMQEALRQAMGETRHSADEIIEASQSLNHAVGLIDQSATAQSSAASAIAANVEELTVSINHVSENTSEAARLANASDEQAEEGHAAIEELVEKINQMSGVVHQAAEIINGLRDESEKISSIVDVIRDIADQTNLLALNAAIEAARAGETGRGFAVVADEVRKLAERTAVSTGEIRGMVTSIQQSTGQAVAGVQHGVDLSNSSVELAQRAGTAIAQLKEMAQQVAEVVNEVNNGLREQSAASTDVVVKIEQVATQSEEASAVAHETASAAQRMDATARRMQEIVARFRH